jgi:hypothetical protein
VPTAEHVGAAHARLSGDLQTAAEDNVTCCYAVQDKVWVDGPDNRPWEIYAVLADARDTAPCCSLHPGQASQQIEAMARR